MRRRLALCFAPLLLAACSGFAQPPSTAIRGAVALDASGDTTLPATLEWPAYEPPPGAGPVTYEVRIWRAQDGLPHEEAARVEDIARTRAVFNLSGPRDEYVWSVRAHFVRDGWPCVSGWYVVAGRKDDDHMLPRRGFPTLADR